jgi:hypothetical protein
MARWDAYRLVTPPGTNTVRQVHLGIVFAPSYATAMRKTINRFKIKTFTGRYDHIKLVLRHSNTAIRHLRENQNATNNVEKLAKGIVTFAQECGLPNGISPGELSDRYTVLNPRDIGRYLCHRLEEVQEHLAPHGVKIISYQETERYGKRIGLAPITT